ncbi:MAG: hypothetical protein NVV83_22905 [Afipia sp.]|nr:hypothetical protein [Afipia sp.]
MIDTLAFIQVVAAADTAANTRALNDRTVSRCKASNMTHARAGEWRRGLAGVEFSAGLAENDLIFGKAEHRSPNSVLKRLGYRPAATSPVLA